MWYEMIPSLGVMFVFLTVPHYSHMVVNYLMNNGKTSARNFKNHNVDYLMYMRDRQVTGSEYIPRGLESVPDAEQS